LKAPVTVVSLCQVKEAAADSLSQTGCISARLQRVDRFSKDDPQARKGPWDLKPVPSAQSGKVRGDGDDGKNDRVLRDGQIDNPSVHASSRATGTIDGQQYRCAPAR
jgi:hypothetical protein